MEAVDRFVKNVLAFCVKATRDYTLLEQRGT